MKELDAYNAAVQSVCDAFRLDCLDGSINDLRGNFWALHDDFVSWGYMSEESSVDDFGYSDELVGGFGPVVSRCGGFVGIRAMDCTGESSFDIFDLSKCLGGMKK